MVVGVHGLFFDIPGRIGAVHSLRRKTKAGPPALGSPEILIAWFG
jgi:hypothetical protein